MANLYISEFAVLATAQSGTAQAAAQPAIATQKVDFSGGVASSAEFNSQTRFVRLQTDAICSVRFGGTATTSYPRMAADQTEYYGVQPGSTLSVISNT